MYRLLLSLMILLCVALACKNGRSTSSETNAGNNSAVSTSEPQQGGGGSAGIGDGKPIAGGVLNEAALEMPKPAYPPTARAVRASGKVVVNVEVATDGHVEKAEAVSGHPLLKAAAAQAALQAKFKPAASPISGTLEYEFKAP
jgi:TonB family protein